MYNCVHCKDKGYIKQQRYIKGYKAIHNQRVRNYSGGRRPRSTDLIEDISVACPHCEEGEKYKKKQRELLSI